MKSFQDVEDVERNHSELLRRISHRLSELGIENKSKSSHKSKFTSNRSRLSSRASTRSSKSIRLEAAAKAAEMAIRLKYHEKETNAERIKMERETFTEKIKIEKDLEIAMAKLRAIKEEEQEARSLPTELQDEADPQERVQE